MAEMKEVWVDYVPEGYEDKIPGHKTYVQIYGECAPGKKPLLVLHGGPGDTHNYLLDLAKIADKYDRHCLFVVCPKGYHEIFCDSERDKYRKNPVPPHIFILIIIFFATVLPTTPKDMKTVCQAE